MESQSISSNFKLQASYSIISHVQSKSSVANASKIGWHKDENCCSCTTMLIYVPVKVDEYDLLRVRFNELYSIINKISLSRKESWKADII